MIFQAKTQAKITLLNWVPDRARVRGIDHVRPELSRVAGRYHEAVQDPESNHPPKERVRSLWFEKFRTNRNHDPKCEPEGDGLLGLGVPGDGLPDDGPVAVPSGLLHRAPVVEVDTAQTILLVGYGEHEEAGGQFNRNKLEKNGLNFVHNIPYTWKMV